MRLNPEAGEGFEIHRTLHKGDPHWQFQVGTGELHAFGGPAPSHYLTHVAGVYDGNLQIRFYIDGKSQGARKLPAKIRQADAVFCIGARYVRGRISAPFNGTISEVRISKVARYKMNFTPQARFEPDADTVLLYHLDEGAGDIAHDASGHGYDGKIVAAEWVRNEPAAGGGQPAAGVPNAAAPLEFPDIKTPRELAEWTLRVGGRVNVGSFATGRDATAEEIAAPDFKLTSVRYDKLRAIDDDAIAHMVRWPLPSKIGLDETSITDAGLRQLAALKHDSLHLTFNSTNITGVGFDAFAGRAFGHLTVHSCPISREGCADRRAEPDLLARRQ